MGYLELPKPGQLLTESEKDLEDKLIEVLGIFRDKVILDGPSRTSHMADVVFYIHGLQTIVMSQAAARAYPDRYRLLGE